MKAKCFLIYSQHQRGQEGAGSFHGLPKRARSLSQTPLCLTQTKCHIPIPEPVIVARDDSSGFKLIKVSALPLSARPWGERVEPNKDLSRMGKWMLDGQEVSPREYT